MQTKSWMIGIQSGKKDPEFLEHRINAFLEEKLNNWTFTEENVKNIVNAKLNKMAKIKETL